MEHDRLLSNETGARAKLRTAVVGRRGMRQGQGRGWPWYGDARSRRRVDGGMGVLGGEWEDEQNSVRRAGGVWRREKCGL